MASPLEILIQQVGGVCVCVCVRFCLLNKLLIGVVLLARGSHSE